MGVITWDQAVDIGPDGRSRGRLASAPAASLRRVDAAFGRSADINEAWRSPQDADENYRKYLAYLSGGPWAPIALPGDKSVHCFGYAIDTDDTSDAQMRIWNDHGWFWTVYRNGELVERWHLEYFLGRDNHRNEPASAPASSGGSAPFTPFQEDDMPINFRNPANGGITYTMVPGFSITAHINAFGSRLTNYVNTGVWPATESDQDRFNAGLRNLNSDHVSWMLGFYGFGRFNANTLPRTGTVYSDVVQGLMDSMGVAVTEAKATHGDTARIIDSITPGQAGVKYDGQLWTHIAKSGTASA
ncbi:MAG: hypothetical protein IJO71_09125 [Microbacterium sp.]|uniref:hypothetical protein n=1 Tax=Microbacterium sp. TaxID=51671 RepID=UPI0025E72563|nr:hypothetical protein [Microbacterium sp.]MBQ9917347.1 hypothetical protein [Microbacterium sp.]